MIGEPGVIKAPNDDYTIVGETASKIARELTKDWHSKVKPLFTESNTSEGAFWKITISTPSGVPVWPNQPRVTVIGDAAHSMTPAGGLGANTAVRDSALLGRLLQNGYYEGATSDYEKEMRVYGSEAVGKSYGMASKMFKIHIDEDKSTTMEGEIRDNRSSA
ncbi:FAD/NAD(P)-binding domain-containing protein, partial [Aureobasidium melanogenum]